jgi:hypothetical protein
MFSFPQDKIISGFLPVARRGAAENSHPSTVRRVGLSAQAVDAVHVHRIHDAFNLLAIYPFMVSQAQSTNG